MTPSGESAAAHEDVDVVQRYFTHWANYESAVSHDYIHHDEMTAAVNERVRERGFVGDLLDLGCGDAREVVAMVDGVGCDSYTGVDVTEAVFDLARPNLAWVDGHVALVPGDFMAVLPTLGAHFDTVLCSLAMHHLPTADKPRFFTEVHERLAPGGVLYLYEPSSRPGEDRDAFIARQAPWFSAHFTGMTPAAVADLNQHVADADFPESPGGYAGMAIDAGFISAEVLFIDDEHFWVLLELRA
jgi:prepilin-type processing-associated H-X9-DG protein